MKYKTIVTIRTKSGQEVSLDFNRRKASIDKVLRLDGQLLIIESSTDAFFCPMTELSSIYIREVRQPEGDESSVENKNI